MLTIATICSGAGLIEAGAVEAGYQPIWGIERDNEVADLHKLNFPKTTLYDWDVTKVRIKQWRSLETPEVLHISPPCQQFSNANNGGAESDSDLAIAKSICKAILNLNPPTITIENVRSYRHSKSWQLIQETLFDAGYYVGMGIFNAADWGVPQDRTRFIAIAQSNKLVCSILPSFRHTTIADSLGDFVETLQPSSLTDGQLNKMRAVDRLKIDAILSRESDEMALINRVGIRNNTIVRYGNETSFCIMAGIATDHKGSSRKTFLNLVYQGRVYSLSARAIARLMGVPDWYQLGGYPNKVTVKGLGNGVPSEFYKQLLQAI